ncbi:MAG: hypothetical protein CME62_03550 [Halobacteriovoraceae bacterium]|nr:hypothetical protein [Halobacteriovoraceae bacterium]|tara:strand:- start:27092 stop:28621 length:1530 start_codon:yes stop_codon:yes gene_type:complete
MKFFLILLFAATALANDGMNILIGNDQSSLATPIIKQQKQLVLDDHFLVQFYGNYMALRTMDRDFMDWAQLFLDKKYTQALKTSFSINVDNEEKNKLVKASRLYLLYKLGLNQSFFNEWLSLSVQSSFLNSPLGIALDQIVGKNASHWFLKNNIYVTQMQRKALSMLEANNTLFNISAQAMFNLRSGLAGLKFIGKLPIKDPLRIKLADSAILSYARQGELAKSAKILKEVYEPVLADEKDINKISAYYLTLARMLYQARAFEASEYYYELIPDEASQFLTARVEKLWISMQDNDLSQVRGDMHTLSQQIFKDKFIPEIYLVSSMANLKTCQFNEVEKNFKTFVEVSKHFLTEIEENLNAKKPKIIDRDDFYLNYLARANQKLMQETKSLEKGYQEFGFAQKQMSSHKNLQKLVMANHTLELKRKWNNRKQLLSSTIRKMRFVKVEFLSTMRRLKNELAQIKHGDEIHLTSSALDKSDRVVFPYDGVLFGDELFNYASSLKNLCLRGRK